MPIHFITSDGELIWNASRKDAYSVKSAYCLTMENVIDSSQLRVPGDWNSI